MSATLRKDALSGIIVFLIALPLCLGIAQASGAPLFAGIISGIVGGIVVGLLSKSQVSVSGPAAGLIAIVVSAIQGFGAFETFLCAVVVAGLVQLLLGLIRAGSIANYFPSNVIEGMLAGIGLTIIIKEFPNAMGFVKGSAVAGIEAGEPGSSWTAIRTFFQHIEPAALIISFLGISLLALWSTKAFKKWSLLPAGLLVVLLATAINEVFLLLGNGLALGPAQLVQLQVPDSAAGFLSQFRLPDPMGFLNPEVWKTGIVIAIVASIETLLCIEATDGMDPHKRYTSGNAELRAQGIGNTLSGLIGGLPITSVIVRSSANIHAGAETKKSTIIHGLMLLVCVATIPTMLNHIPKAALSAILIYTGYRLCRPATFRHMWQGGLAQFIPFVATAVAVVALDLLKGVGIGLAISIFYMLRQNLRVPFFYKRSIYSKGELIRLTLSEEVSFLNKAAIKQTLKKIPSGASVIIDARHSEYIDFDVLNIIRDFAKTHAPEAGIKVSLIGFKNRYKLPADATEREVLQTFIEAGEVPRRSAGNHQKLLRQLSTP
ncbi:MAG: SulP family inorganic anion transporter [Bacteroidetes bacterium]|nr:SulP family inorganic anion transporter [Bacteroidota bacterium]